MVSIQPYSILRDTWIPRDTIVFDPEINRGKYCVLPYPRHPKGCPNFNKCSLCPPHAPYGADLIKPYTRVLLFTLDLDFKEYRHEMTEHARSSELDWSEAQISNLYYYQNQARKLLYERVNRKYRSGDLVFGMGSGFGFNCCSMEASGIDVMQTYRNNGVVFEERMRDQIVFGVLLCKKPAEIPFRDFSQQKRLF